MEYKIQAPLLILYSLSLYLLAQKDHYSNVSYEKTCTIILVTKEIRN